jgi:hypothetical protein
MRSCFVLFELSKHDPEVVISVLLQAYSQHFLSTVEACIVDISCFLYKVAVHCPRSFWFSTF